MTEGSQNDHRILRLVRLARAYEAGGIYNGAKLLRALAFSEETRQTNLGEEPVDLGWMDAEMRSLIAELSAEGLREVMLRKLEAARVGALENRTISYEESPAVLVCRFCGHIAFHQPPQRCPGCGARSLSFREFPPYYYLEPISPTDALQALQDAAQELAEGVGGLSEAQMSWQPQEEEWGVRGLVWHLLVAQQLLDGRLEKMLSQENPSLKSLAAWAVGSQEALTGREILDAYLSSRQKSIQRLSGLSPAGWLRTGVHDEFGQVTVLQQAGYFARHDQYHLPQLHRLLDSLLDVRL